MRTRGLHFAFLFFALLAGVATDGFADQGPGGAKRQVIVRRGEHLTMDAKAGSVTSSVQVEALQDGAQGETIQVRNLQSGRLQTARVVQPGIAEVLH
jgi:hypothetical protein